MDYTIFQQLGIALLLGSLVGLEREQKYQLFGKGGSFAGLRTFALIGLMGAVSQTLSVYSVWIFILLTVGFLSLVVISYFVTSKKGAIGITSEIGAVLVYVVGILCGMGEYVVATAIAIVVMMALHFKKRLHDWAEEVKDREIISTIQFIIIAFVVLPLLPNEVYGPYNFFNPYVIWLMVVFISGISFASYIAIRIFGTKKGIGLSGFLAGLISSTALTLSFSEQSKKNKKIVNPYAFAVVVASTAMFFRILIEVAVLNRGLFPMVAVPMVSMGVAGIVAAWILWRKKDSKKEVSKHVERDVVQMKSPFSLIPALKFGAFFAFILFLSKAALAWMGDQGLYITSLVSAVLDVDAITVSVANLAKNGLSELTATMAIFIAAATNTFVKGGIFLFLGNKKVSFRIIFAFVFVLVIGGISMFFI